MRPRSRIRAAALVVLVLALTACGVRIDTDLTVNGEGAGMRVMSLTLGEGEDSLLGGVQAADASIRRHLPEGVEYSGIERNAEGALVLTLSVPFSSADDYRQVMARLLTAGDLSWPEGDSFTAQQGEFVEGVHIQESFSSADLLAWLFAGLIADGVVAEENEGSMWQLGSTTVNFNDASHESLNPISFSQVADRGFSAIEMRTSFGSEGFSRDITFALAQKAQYNSAPTLYDGYFDALAGLGMAVEVDPDTTGMVWTVGFAADDVEGLVDQTNQVLSSEETVFTLTDDDEGGLPMTLLTRMTNFAECAAICSPDSPPISDTLLLPEGYHLEGGDGNMTETGLELMLTGPTSAVATLARTVSFVSADVALEIARDGAVTWTADLTLPTADAELLGERVEAVLSSDGVAEVTTAEDSGTATYSVEVSGQDAGEFQAAFQQWSGSQNAYLDVVEREEHGFFRTHLLVEGALPLTALLGESLPPNGVNYTFTVHGGALEEGADVYFAPPQATVEGGSARFLLADGEMFTFQVTGVPVGAWVAYGLIAVLLLVMAVVVVVFRTKIRALVGRVREARERRAAAAAQYVAPPEATAVAVQVNSEGPWPETPAEAGTPSVGRGTSEADYL